MYKKAITNLLIMITSSMLIAQTQTEVINHHPDLLFMVEQAIKAPSGHNTQPWLFQITENCIEIHPNYDKSLPVVDRDNRELFISLGCALENLSLAASVRSYKSETFIGENGIITINLLPDTSIKSQSELFNQIPIRQTNRSGYNNTRISSDTLILLQQMPKEDHISIRFYENGTSEFDSIRSYIEKGNRLQMQDKAFKKELKEWMRYNKKHTNATHDGLSYNVFGAPNLPRFISKPIIGAAINERSQVKGDNRKILSSSHVVLFTTQNNTLTEWINLGRTLQRFLLYTTELGIVHSYFNQPNEITELSLSLADILQIKEEYPTILLRIGYGNPMPYSPRKKVEEVIIGK